MKIQDELINNLINVTKIFIEDNKSKNNSLKNVKNKLDHIDKLLLKIMEDYNQTLETEKRKEKLLELQSWINNYQEHIEQCKIILEKYEITKNYSEKSCLNLILYITLFFEMKQKINLNSLNESVIGKITNLHNILEQINYAYRNIFYTDEDLIDKNSLPVKITPDVTEEEYLKYVEVFYGKEKVKEEIISEKNDKPNIYILEDNMTEYEKRSRDLEIYKRKLNKKLTELKNKIYLIGDNSYYLKDVLIGEINRIQSITTEDLQNLNKDLKIPNPNEDINVILDKLMFKSNLSMNFSTPILNDKKIDVFIIDRDINSKSNYKHVGRRKKRFSLKKNILNALKFLGLDSFLVEKKSQKKPKENFDNDYQNFINIGDKVKLRNSSVHVYKDSLGKIVQIPLYSADTERIVEKIYMQNGDKLLEISNTMERNYYIDLGYIPIMIKTFDGYYKASDVLVCERGLML